MIDKIKKLLFKHDYITVVQKSGDGCIITYPHPKLIYEVPRLVEFFTFQRGDKPGLWGTTSYDKEEEGERFIDVPEYAIRIYVMYEIVACNMRIPIDPSLIIYLDENEKEQEDIDMIINAPSGQDNRQKEGFLYGLVIGARNDGFPPEYDEIAKTHGVQDGYNIIKRFYTNSDEEDK